MRATRVHALRTAERPHPGRKHGGNFQAKEDTSRRPSGRRFRRKFMKSRDKDQRPMYSQSGGD